MQRAYARRAQRMAALDPAGQGTARPNGPARQNSVAGPGIVVASRTPFVVLVMVLLSVTLVATLWLSTAAAADSYRLQSARDAARDLAERSEQLGREVAALETAPELARRAGELGMVPAGDPARLKVAPDGAVVLVGEPRPAMAPSASRRDITQARPRPPATPAQTNGA